VILQKRCYWSNARLSFTDIQVCVSIIYLCSTEEKFGLNPWVTDKTFCALQTASIVVKESPLLWRVAEFRHGWCVKIYLGWLNLIFEPKEGNRKPPQKHTVPPWQWAMPHHHHGDTPVQVERCIWPWEMWSQIPSWPMSSSLGSKTQSPKVTNPVITRRNRRGDKPPYLTNINTNLYMQEIIHPRLDPQFGKNLCFSTHPRQVLIEGGPPRVIFSTGCTV